MSKEAIRRVITLYEMERNMLDHVLTATHNIFSAMEALYYDKKIEDLAIELKWYAKERKKEVEQKIREHKEFLKELEGD